MYILGHEEWSSILPYSSSRRANMKFFVAALVAAFTIGVTACDTENAPPVNPAPTTTDEVTTDLTTPAIQPEQIETTPTPVIEEPVECNPPFEEDRVYCGGTICTLEWTSDCTTMCNSPNPWGMEAWGGYYGPTDVQRLCRDLNT